MRLGDLNGNLKGLKRLLCEELGKGVLGKDKGPKIRKRPVRCL